MIFLYAMIIIWILFLFAMVVYSIVDLIKCIIDYKKDKSSSDTIDDITVTFQNDESDKTSIEMAMFSMMYNQIFNNPDD